MTPHHHSKNITVPRCERNPLLVVAPKSFICGGTSNLGTVPFQRDTDPTPTAGRRCLQAPATVGRLHGTGTESCCLTPIRRSEKWAHGIPHPPPPSSRLAAQHQPDSPSPTP